MAGPGIRAYRFATELAKKNDVTLAVPFDTDLVSESMGIVRVVPEDAHEMTALATRFDTVIAQRLPVKTMLSLTRAKTRTVYDLYAPVVAELLAFDLERTRSRAGDLWFRCVSLQQEVVLRTGDAFVCASEHQRDFWLGALASLGRPDQDAYHEDPSLRALIDVVPFGIEPVAPTPGEPVVKGVVPGIACGDKVLLWASGIWDWLDPLTVIRAVHLLSQRRGDIRLYFLGVKHPNPAMSEMTKVAEAMRLAEDLGLRDRVVFFNTGWVPYAERGRYLLEADLGVSAHHDNLETRLAYRVRLVDCFWAGLPVVTTRGDSLSELVEKRELGCVVDFEDVDGWVGAIESLLDDPDAGARIDANAAHVRREFAWPRVVATLERLLTATGKRSQPTLRLRLLVAQYLHLRLRLSMLRRGALGTILRMLQLFAAAVSQWLR